MDTALGTSIGLFPSAIITRHLTERTSTLDIAEALVRSSLSDTASYEEPESNFRPGKPLTESIDKIVRSDVETLATPMEPLGQYSEVSASQNRKSAIVEPPGWEHNGTIQQLHQRGSSPDYECATNQVLRYDEGSQT